MRRGPTQRQTDGELYYVIKNGVRLTGMPAFGEPGNEDHSSWHLVCFIRHLPKMTADEEIQMRELNPKTRQDLDEERQEQEFLNGGAVKH
ncbi:MAG: cbb3-type cytochrome c oxidase subunit [Bryobacterales bacterium]|nr:cbb3-type cytochrome c oxidase subunit [Bryobacterales bacterium]